MAGQIIISNIKTDSDNAFSILANTGAVLFSANLASGITTGIADGSVTNAKLAGSITGDKIATGQITGNLLTANCVSGNNIVSSPTITGNVTINGSLGIGGATPASSGFGITFPATQVPSADANTLDDYEEGTFTYTLPCSTSGSFTVRNIYTSGYYTKVGRVVTININFESSGSSSPVGNLQFAGLPFATANSPSGGQNNMWIPIIVRGTTGTIASFYLYFGANTTTGTFTYQDTSGTFNNLAVANISSGASGYIEGSIQFSYPIN